MFTYLAKTWLLVLCSHVLYIYIYIYVYIWYIYVYLSIFIDKYIYVYIYIYIYIVLCLAASHKSWSSLYLWSGCIVKYFLRYFSIIKQKNSCFRRNSIRVNYRKRCHVSDCKMFAIGYLVVYGECYRFKRTFFILSCFLSYTSFCFSKCSFRAISST